MAAFSTLTPLLEVVSGDEHHHAPILFTVVVVVFAVVGGHETQHLAVNVGRAGSFELLANVAGDFDDVVHQQIDVGEDGHIDVLQHVVCAVALRFPRRRWC